MTIPANYLAELDKGINSPNIIIELEADSGTLKYGLHTGDFSDVCPCVKNISSLQNKLDPKKGISLRGKATFTLAGRDNFKSLIRDEYLKNRRVVFKSGFVVDGYAYADYVEFYTGLISDWDRKGDELTITVADDLAAKITTEIPIAPSSNLLSTTLNYQNQNPVDIILDLVLAPGDRINDITGEDNLNIPLARVDQANMIAERDDWIPGLKFERVLSEPKAANKYLNELQIEAGLFLFHNGSKVDIKIFAPIKPGQTLDTFTDDFNLLQNSLTQNSGYLQDFYNKIIVYSDYKETGGDEAKDFEYAAIAIDTVSQGSAAWDEVRAKIFKLKWVRSRTYTQPSAIGGVEINHMSRANPPGSGMLSWNATNNTLQWMAPEGTTGAAIEITEDGPYRLSDANNQASIQVIVDFALLDAESTQGETITVTALAGDNYAQTLANRALVRFTNPVGTIKWTVGINDINNGTAFRKPGDFINITTDEAFEFGEDTWILEQLMFTSIRVDFVNRIIAMEATETKLAGSSYNSKVGFIHAGPSNDYGSATDDEKEYAYIAPLTGGDPAYVIW